MSTIIPFPDQTPTVRREHRHRLVLGVLAVALALLAAASLSWLALPALVAVMLGTVIQKGRARWWVGVVGGIVVTCALVRFTLEWATPSIILAGQEASEKRAVSHLREILWAEDQTLSNKFVDTDGDGVPEYALMGELTDTAEPRPGVKPPIPMLRPDQYHDVPAPPPWRCVFRSEGYDYVVYLPARSGGGVADGNGERAKDIDSHEAARRWVGYAWPSTNGQGGHKAFFIDQDERICESENTQGYSGIFKVPPATAALQGSRLDSPPCGQGQDGGLWTPWKGKKARAPRTK